MPDHSWIVVLEGPLPTGGGESANLAKEGRQEMVELTERELEVLGLVAKGWTNRGIVKELGISERTVAFHVEQLLSKLNARNRTEAVVEAIRCGWLGV
jgi:DNA-binding NarL/FixJ family response regulator